MVFLSVETKTCLCQLATIVLNYGINMCMRVRVHVHVSRCGFAPNQPACPYAHKHQCVTLLSPICLGRNFKWPLEKKKKKN